MRTPGTPGFKPSLLLMVLATLTVACAGSTRQMISLPEVEGAPHGGTVVLFRVTVESDGKLMRAMLSPLPRWKWHYLVNVGPRSHPLDTGRTFAAGQLDSMLSRDAGWGFLTLKPGAYQIAFAAYRTKFAMPDAQSAALGFGQSNASQLEVASDVRLLYVGTFAFTCHNVERWWFYEEHECTKLEVSDEEELARQVAALSLGRFGPMQKALASTR
jgi:hypothetical protein